MNTTNSVNTTNTPKYITKIVTFYSDGTFTESLPTSYGPMPSWPSWPYPNNPTVKPMCSKCGLVLESAMSYCCPNGDCPCGMGPAMCSTNSTNSTNSINSTSK